MEEYAPYGLEEYKTIADKSPRKFLDQHLADAIKRDQFELAAHIRDRITLLDSVKRKT